MPLPSWDKIRTTQTYQSASPVEQAQMRDEWFNTTADEAGIQGSERDEFYDKFINTQNKSVAIENKGTRPGEPVKGTPEYQEFEDRYSGLSGSFLHAFTQGNWLSKLAVDLDEYTHQKYGWKRSPINEEVQKQKAAGWEYGAKTKGEERVHRLTEMTPDIAAMIPVGKAVTGTTRAMLSLIPKVNEFKKAITLASVVAGGYGSMGAVSGIKEVVDPQTGDVVEAVTEGGRAGAVGTAADVGLEALVNLAPNQGVRTIAKIGKEIVSPVVQAGLNTVMGDDQSQEAFEENLFDMAALQIAHAPRKVHEEINMRKSTRSQAEYIKEMAGNLSTYEQLDTIKRFTMNTEGKKKSAELVDVMADSISQSLAEKSSLSLEFMKTQEGRDIVEEHGSPTNAKEYYKKRIMTTKYKGKDIYNAVNTIIEKRYTPEQIENLGKAEVYHALDRIFMGKVSYLEKYKKQALGEYHEMNKPEVAVSNDEKNSLSRRITETDLEIVTYNEFRDSIKTDPLYSLTNPSFDFSEASKTQIMDMSAKLTGDIVKDQGVLHSFRHVMEREWVNSFEDAISKASSSGAAMMELRRKTLLDGDLLGGQWKAPLEQFRKMSPEYNEAVRLVLSRKNLGSFEKYCKEKNFNIETKTKLLEIAEGQRAVLDQVKATVEGLGVHGFHAIEKGYFPRIMQERYLVEPKLRKEFIDDMISKGQVLRQIAGAAVRERNGVVEKVFKNDRGEQTWREYALEERRTDMERFLNELRSANRERTYGHIQKERQFNWIPEKYLETDVYGVLAQYYERTAKRICEIRNYGDGDEKLMAHLMNANKELAENPAISNRDHINAMQDLQRAYKLMTYQKRGDAHVSHLVDGWMALQTLRKMPLSAIGQTGQFFSGIARSGQVVPTAWGKAAVKRMFGSNARFYNAETGKHESLSMRDIAIMCGSANTAIMNDITARMTGDVNSVLTTAVQHMLNWNGFKKMDSINRVQAAGTGWFYAEDLIGRVNRIAGTAEARKMTGEELLSLFQKKKIFTEGVKDKFAKRRLEQLDLNLDEILKRGRNEQGKFYLTKKELLTAARKFEIDTNFRASEFDLPKQFTKTGAGRLIAQFNSYNYSRTKELKNLVFKEAKQGNIAPLLWTLAAGGIVGSGIEGVRSLLTGKDLPDNMKDWIFEAMSNFGALGYFSNVYATLEYGSTNLGPTADDIRKMANCIQSMNNTASAEPAARLIVKELPYVGWIGRRVLAESDKKAEAEKLRLKNISGGSSGFGSGFDSGFGKGFGKGF